MPQTPLSPQMQALIKEITVCPKCRLAETRKRAVPGEGPENATIMFIGEAPGYHENEQGRPFVGNAGHFLDQLLASIGLKRTDVYITNIVKCRPPQNRDPMPDEIAACAPYLDRQIALIKPKMIVTLGRYSMAKFFPGESISKIHGQPRKRNGIIYFPMYHPAAALHQPSLRSAVEADMLKIPQILEEESSLPDPAAKDNDAEQLSMF